MILIFFTLHMQNFAKLSPNFSFRFADMIFILNFAPPAGENTNKS